MFWGISEALDLYQEYINAFKIETKQTTENDTDNETSATSSDTANSNTKSNEEETTANQPSELNVLLIGASDPRHIIKTMAKLYQHRATENGSNNAAQYINIYVIEGCAELVARTIVLLSIALENPELLNIRLKAHLFMDIYGNSLLRPVSHQYLIGKAKSLIKLISDSEILEKIAPMISIEHMKYRERDGLENAFEFWLPKDTYIYNIKDYWTARLRKDLSTRYDYREGSFDWDYNMVLKDRDANQLCSQEYRYWRETGIAFTFPEYEQCKPNKTYSVGLVRNGSTYKHRGYIGDIHTGPFCTYGLKTTDSRLTNSEHGNNDYRATDVTERNLLEFFYELQTQTPYEHNIEISRKYGSVKLLMGKLLTWNECDINSSAAYDKPWLSTAGVKVYFLSTEDIINIQNAATNTRWLNFFDVIFVGFNYFTLLKDDIYNIFKTNGLLLLETKLYTVARKEQVAEHETKLKDFAKKINLKPVINYNAINAKNSILKYKKVEPLSC